VSSGGVGRHRPASPGAQPGPAQCGPGIRLGTGGWPAFIRYELSCGEFTKGGQRRIGGIEAIQLTGNAGQETIWVNPRTYLPVRTVFHSPRAHGIPDFPDPVVQDGATRKSITFPGQALNSSS
jgi:hypothetical protein